MKVHARSRLVPVVCSSPRCPFISHRSRSRMKWCEVDRSRVSLLKSRRVYPAVAIKSRRRHVAQETKHARPTTMHHQLHVGYANVGAQGGTIPERITERSFALIASLLTHCISSDTVLSKVKNSDIRQPLVCERVILAWWFSVANE